MLLNKKLIAILILAVLIVGGVYMVSAGWLNSLFGITEVNGLHFKIPDGYSENTTDAVKNDGSVSKRFSNNGNHICIDVYNNSDNSYQTYGKKCAMAGTYNFYVKDTEDHNINIAITKTGGHIISMNSDRNVEVESITQEEANELY